MSMSYRHFKLTIKLLLRQAAMDFRKRSLGTLLGSVWSILSPLATIALIYFVFTYGLKAGVVGNVSFIHWLVPGMLAWFYIQEAIGTGCMAIIESSYLVTKVVFPVWILPISKTMSALPVHLFLMGIFVILLLVQGGSPLPSWAQLGYYLFCSFCLCTVISFITSALAVFIRDTMNIVGVVLQFMFWGTPIFWNPNMLVGTRFEWILFNPANYILQGYRDSLFNALYFWERPLETLVFWGVMLMLSLCAWYLYKQTRPHFADVL